MEGKNDRLSVYAHFEDIEIVLTKHIGDAESEIFIAVAWFTNQTLFNHLLRAAKRGVKVKLLTLYDRVNVSGDVDFQMIVDAGGELYLSSSSNPVLHNKYCIIDGKIVITGSYNFTYYAENVNSENIVVISSHMIASQYIDNFLHLIETNDRVSDYVQYKSTHKYQRDVFDADVFLEIEDDYRYVCSHQEDDFVNERFVISSPSYDETGGLHIQRIVYKNSELVISFQTKLSGICSRCFLYSQNTRGVWRLESQSSNKVYEAYMISNVKVDDTIVVDVTESNTCYHLNHSGLDLFESKNYDFRHKWIKTPYEFLFSCDIHFNVPELEACLYSLYEGDDQMRKLAYRWNVLNINLVQDHN